MGAQPPQAPEPENENFKPQYPEAGKDKFWSSDKTAIHPVYLSKEGIASSKAVTLGEALKTVSEGKYADSIALRVERDDKGNPVTGTAKGTWVTWTWKKYYDDCRTAGKALMALGLQPSDCVSLIGFNAPEWFIGFLGCVFAGGIGAGIYTTNSPDACKYVAEHAECKVVVCEDQKQLVKFIAKKDELPNLKTIVMYTDNYDKDKAKEASDDNFRIISWKEFMAMAENTKDEDLDARMGAAKPGNVCSYIYTSGTTGNPKAVMLSHDNISFNAQCVIQIIASCTNIGTEREERMLSYLPLSHVAGLMLDIVAPIMLVYKGPGWGRIDFARPDALKGTLPDALKETRPTMFLGVPRVWEKIKEAMVQKVRANPPKGMKASVANWAKGVGISNARNKQLGGSGSTPWGISLADKLVFSTVKDALGLDKCEFAFTGAAPITVDVLEFFGQLGVQINEVYGMSESTGATTWSSTTYHKWGSCGYEMPGVEVKIDHSKERGDKEGEGELCYRGRHIMKGYMANKNMGQAHIDLITKKNRAAIDDDGWLHSEDIGRKDENGMYYITGRIKELIIGAGGENIAPVPIEDKIKSYLPALANVMMVGDKRKFNTMLVTAKCKINAETGEPLDDLMGEALEVNPEVKTVKDAMNDEKWIKYVTEGITKYNNNDAVSRAQKIQKFKILPVDFSTVGGELTATLKLKRSVAQEKYMDLIDEMYSGAKPPAKAEEKASA